MIIKNHSTKKRLLTREFNGAMFPLIIVGFTLTVVNDFRRFLSRFSTYCHDILQALFSIDLPGNFIEKYV